MSQNELDQRAMGGTELVGSWLEKHVDKELLSHFQIVRSRVRELDPTKIPILWLHDLPLDPEAAHLNSAESRARFAKLVFVSNWQLQQYNNFLGVPYSDSYVLRNAITPFKTAEIMKPDPKKELRIIYHPTPHRGLNILVPVFEALAQEFPNIHLDVYSSFKLYGWEERDKPYQELFDRCKSHPRIHYHGSVPNAEVRKALGKAHIFAYPSIWQETSCICAMEAMSARCSIVTPNLAALPETTAGFASMYQFDENIEVHANRFYQVLRAQILATMHEPSVLLQTAAQATYANQMYSWDVRRVEWNALLTDLLRVRRQV